MIIHHVFFDVVTTIAIILEIFRFCNETLLMQAVLTPTFSFVSVQKERD